MDHNESFEFLSFHLMVTIISIFITNIRESSELPSALLSAPGKLSASFPLELELKLELELVGDCSGSGREEVGSEYPGGGRELLRREV